MASADLEEELRLCKQEISRLKEWVEASESRFRTEADKLRSDHAEEKEEEERQYEAAMNGMRALVAQMAAELRCFRPPQTPREFGTAGMLLTYIFKASLRAIESGLNLASRYLST